MAKKLFTITILMLFLLKIVQSNYHNPKCTHDGLNCLNCTHRALCTRWWFWAPLEHWGEPTPCSDPSTGHSLPYCEPETNKCVSHTPQLCSSKVSCLREEEGNYYPDIRDCRKYVRCQKGVPKVAQCDRGMVYKQQWRKCVINLSNRRDCFEVAECAEPSRTYPGDSSMYYKCGGDGVMTLAICRAYNEEYDGGCCRESQCASAGDDSLLAIPYKCTAYFDCHLQTEMNCPMNQGFNVRTKNCAPFHNKLCNEFSLLENNVKSLLGRTFIFNFAQKLFDLINFSPYAFLSILPIPDSIISASILITDYIYNERTFPSGLINYLIESALSSIPPQIRTLFDILLNLVPIKLTSTNHLTIDQQIALAIEQQFANINFTHVAGIIKETHSVPKAFQIFIKHVSNRVNVPPENVYGILQLVAPIFVQIVNRLFGAQMLLFGDKELTFDPENLRTQLERIVGGDLGGFVRLIFVGGGYKWVQSIAKEVYLPLHA